MASLQAPSPEVWLPSWSPESLYGKTFAYLRDAKPKATEEEEEEELKYPLMKVKLVEMERADFVVVADCIDPENEAYLKIMKEARRRQIPILTISDLKLANSALKDNTTRSHEIPNLKPTFNVSEEWIDEETFQLTFGEETVEYLKSENEKYQRDDREILQHELLLRDPTVREIFKNSPWEKLKSLIVENPPRIRGTRWTLEDVLKDYIAEAWREEGHEKWIWKWDETEFDEDYQGSAEFKPTEAVRVALCVFLHDNKDAVEKLVGENSSRKIHKKNTEEPIGGNTLSFPVSIEACQVSMTPEFRHQKYKDLKMNHAITTAGKVAREPCVELCSEDIPPNFIAVDIPEEDNYIECHSERKRNFLNNGFTKALFNKVAPIVIANLEASTSDGEPEMRRTDHDIEYYSVASVLLTQEFVRPTENFVNRIKEALAKPSDERHVQLQMIWDQFGYIWSSELSLGGKRDYLEDYWQTDPTALKNSEDSRAISEFQVEACEENAEDVKDAITAGDRTALKVSDSEKTAWQKNILQHPDIWAIIKRDSIVPIYELLETGLRNAVVEVIDLTLATKREGRCIAKNSTVSLKNCHNKLHLQWSRRYLTTKAKAMIVNTSSIDPAASVKKWTFAPTKDSKEPNIRYNDVIRICGESSSKFDDGNLKLYLHGSLKRHAPVSKDGEEVSLREYTENLSTPGDNWVIERVEDPSLHAGVKDFGVDLLKYDSTYVCRYDRVRLRLESTTNHYLASHDVSLKNIWVRKKANDIIPRLFTGNKAQKSKEVLLLDLACVDSRDEWEVDNLDAVTNVFGENTNDLVTRTMLNTTNATEDQSTVKPGLKHLSPEITESSAVEQEVFDANKWLESKPIAASSDLGKANQGSSDIYASAPKTDLEATGDSASVHSEFISMPPVCTNCGTMTTSLWSKDPDGHLLCTECSLYLKLNEEPRPLTKITKKGLRDSQCLTGNEDIVTNEEEDVDSFPHENENTAFGNNWSRAQLTTFGRVVTFSDERPMSNTDSEANVSEQQENPRAPKAIITLEGDLRESATLKRPPVWLKQSQSLGPGIAVIVPRPSTDITEILPQSATSSTIPPQGPIIRDQVHIVDGNMSKKDFAVDSVPPELEEAEAKHQRSTEEPKCSNCGTSSTPMWGKGPKDVTLCNKCSLYLKLNGKRRPVSRRDVFDLERVVDSDDDGGADDEKEEALGKEIPEMADVNTKGRLASTEFMAEIRNNMKTSDMNDGKMAREYIEKILNYDTADLIEDRTTSLKIQEKSNKNTKKIDFLGRFGDSNVTLVSRRGSDSSIPPRLSTDSEDTLVNTGRGTISTLDPVSENVSFKSNAKSKLDEWEQEGWFDIDVHAPKIVSPEKLKRDLESVEEYDSSFEEYQEWQKAIFEVDTEASNIFTVDQLAKALSQSQRLDSIDGDESLLDSLLDDTQAYEPWPGSLSLPMRSNQFWKSSRKSGVIS